MKKALTLLSILLLFLLSACGSSSDVKTGGTKNSTEKNTTSANSSATKKEDNTKTIDASNQTVSVAGMDVGLGEIKIAEDKISVGMHFTNTTNAKLTFYPDQGSVVIGDMQLEANAFMGKGDLGGDVQAGVKKDGVIVFPAPEGKKIDVKSVTQIKILFGDVTTADYMTSAPVEFNLTIQ